MNLVEFYPTPRSLLDKIFEGVDYRKIRTILEPSAGKGDIAEYIYEKANEYPYYNQQITIDCIELEPELRNILKGKKYPVIHDNFLTFRTFKRYDLIVMNPPFSNGDEHLLKALSLAENGGNIICILNAETIRNPYTNRRKMLNTKLNDLEADIQYYSDEFVSAERSTSVEVAVVKVSIPNKTSSSFIYEDLKCRKFTESVIQQPTDIIAADYIKAAVQHYELEVEAGINLIKEYQALSPYILNSLKKEATYNEPILQLKVGDHSLSINDYVERVRMKYWYALFNDPRFTGNMTSKQREDYNSKVRELKDYDFSYYNIKTLQEQMSRNIVAGIEECIVKLFDELSHQYSYSGYGTDKNIHYYNGATRLLLKRQYCG